MRAMSKVTFMCVFATLLFGLVTASAAKEAFTFWASGYPQSMQDWLKQDIFPKFEQQHNVSIQLAEIGWGGPREEKLLTAYAGGVFPDVFMNGGENYAMPLDKLISTWQDARLIDKGFWDAVRDRRTGSTFYLPQMAEVRGFIYNKRLFLEAGLDPLPPRSWQEMLNIVKRLTKLEGDAVTQSGFETIWGVPYVGSEYDWFLLQAGSCLHSPDARTSTLDTDDALAALKMMAEVYTITHPAGYSALGEGHFPRGQVAISRGYQAQLTNTIKSNPADVEYLDVYAPKRFESQRGVSLAFVNGLAISNQTKNQALAWEFVKYLMSQEVQAGMTAVGDKLAVRRDVGTNTRLPGVRQFAPWYNIMDTVTPPSFFPGRTAAANYIQSVLQSKMAPENAIIQMQQVGQTALDNYWKQ